MLLCYYIEQTQRENSMIEKKLASTKVSVT